MVTGEKLLNLKLLIVNQMPVIILGIQLVSNENFQAEIWSSY